MTSLEVLWRLANEENPMLKKFGLDHSPGDFHKPMHIRF